MGAEAVASLDQGVRWMVAGGDGTTTPGIGVMPGALRVLDYINADLVMPEWGINEYLQQLPLATFKARVIDVMQYV